MVPDIDYYTLFNVDHNETAEASTQTAELGMSLKFDYETERFVLVDGTNVIPSKIDSIKQWIELFIRTELMKYGVYTEVFGIDTTGILGYRLPQGYRIAEIMRRTNEGILELCPGVVSVSDWSFDMGHFEFTVTTDTGEEVRISG